jgi:hypothetical protein
MDTGSLAGILTSNDSLDCYLTFGGADVSKPAILKIYPTNTQSAG